MRFLINTIFLFHLVGFSVAQNYKYIVTEDAVWSTVEIHCLPNGNLYSSHHIMFEGDTIIDNITYQKIYRSNYENLTDWIYYGLIREDDQNRVFFKPPGYPEGMIYHFGVSDNDTIKAVNTYLNAMDTLNFVVTSVDSIELLDQYRKRITLHEYLNDKEEVWVEGLGSYYGVLNSCNNAYGAICGGYEALCYEEEETLVYQHPLYETCHYAALVNVSDEKSKNDVHIYPNPVDDRLYIDFKESIVFENDILLELFSLDGKKIIEKKLTKNKNILYLHEVNKGHYILIFSGVPINIPPFKILFD